MRILLLVITLLTTSALAFINSIKNVKKECISDLKSLLKGAFTFEPWAIKMLDASHKLNSGITSGNIHFLGDFDLCLSIKETVNDREIEGQYCTVLLTIQDEWPLTKKLSKFKQELTSNFKFEHKIIKLLIENVTIPIGRCIPKSCTPKDFQNLVNGLFKNFKLSLQVTLDDLLCTYKNKPLTITRFDVVAYIIFACLLTAIAASTFYDLYSKGIAANVLVSFSLYSNIKKLFGKEKLHPDSISCLKGLRVLNNVWFTFGHFSIASTLISTNGLYLYNEWKNTTATSIITAAFFTNDTFFAISGLLTTYGILSEITKGRFKLSDYYLLRILRVFPSLLCIVLIHSSFLKLFADGPLGGAVVDYLSTQCYNVYWMDLLFLSNFIESTQMCCFHLWFLAINTQLSFCLPFFLMLIKKYQSTVLTAMLFIFGSCVYHNYAVSVQNKFGYQIFDYNQKFMKTLYTSIFFHTPPYLVGVIFGYLLQLGKKGNLEKFRVPVLLGSFSTIILLMLSQVPEMNEDKNSFTFIYVAALYNGFSKALWALAVCCIIFVCSHGYGGIINSFLSSSWFTVVDRLTFSNNLVQVAILTVLSASKKQATFVGTFDHLMGFFGMYSFILFCAICFCVSVELPFVNITKYVKTANSERELKQD